jgi:nitroreductase
MRRTADHEIEPYLLHRHSQRAMNGEPLGDEDLLRVLEAARWAPSSANLQPWRFLYAQAGTPSFAQYQTFLHPFNAVWCARAGALVVVLSKKTLNDGRHSTSHEFDAGAAWMSLALQASSMGLVSHAIGGISHEKIREELHVPDDFAIHCMVVLGHRGNPDDLPEALRPREAPSARRPLAELIDAGAFPTKWSTVV